MTDETNSAAEQSSPEFSDPVMDSPPSPVFTQEDLDREAQRRSNEAAKNARLAERRKMQAEQSRPQPAYEEAAPSASTNSPVRSEQDVEAIAQRKIEELMRAHQQAELTRQAQGMVQEFESRLSKGKETYEDFDEVVGGLPFKELPGLVQQTLGYDNTADLLYEISKNHNLLQLEEAAHARPGVLKTQLDKLASSISKNKKAKASYPRVPAPLDQVDANPQPRDVEPVTAEDWKHHYASKRRR